ncbi:MAG: PAS domain S-box protein [Flavisolibacter sp.]
MISEDLQIPQESYLQLLESIKNYAVYIVDTGGHIITWNKRAEEIYGYSQGEIIGKHISLFYPAKELENNEPERNLSSCRQSGHYETEGWRIRKDNSLLWVRVSIMPLKNKGEDLIGFGITVQDTSMVKGYNEDVRQLNTDLEYQLRKSKSEVLDYKHALDESSIVAITDQKGIINYVNSNFCKISKYAAQELIGQDHRIINSTYHSKEFIRELWVTIANGKIWRGELRNKAKDGTIYWVDTTIVPFLNEKGKPYQYMAIRSDITSRKLAEEEIIKINQDLERKIKERTFELTEALEREKELSEIKSRFVSMASHEFRTPLSTVLSSASLLSKYITTEDQDKRNRHIDKIQSSVKHLNDILEDFLSLGKLEEGKVRTSIGEFNLKDLLTDTIDEIQATIKNGQKIILNYNGNLIIESDEKLLRNILINLLNNAVKFSEPGKNIYVNGNVSDDLVKFSVRDEGIGIAKEDMEQLFTSFFRAKNAINIQGTGLGLHIVKRYLDLLGGQISLQSELSKGTTITFSLPTRYQL